MPFPVILSFYTKGTPYQQEVCNLIASCRRFGLVTRIEGIRPFGSWELNCAYKPFYIWQALQQLAEPVLWVDADGCFLQSPQWQPAFEGDFSVRFHAELGWDHPSKVVTSTVFVAPTALGEQILRRWMDETRRQLLDPRRTAEFWDQIALREALQGWEGTWSPMPLAYAKIFDHPSDCLLVPQPVIEHYQASRRWKKGARSDRIC